MKASVMFSVLSLVSIVGPQVALAQTGPSCYELQREIQNLEYQRDVDTRELRRTEEDLNRAADQIDENRRSLSSNMDRNIQRAGRVSSECEINISNGFANPNDRSVAQTVNGEEVNSGIVCRDRGANDAYCIQKRACLQVAYAAQADYNSFRRNDSQLNSRYNTLRSRRENLAYSVRQEDRRIQDLRNQLRYCH